MSMGKVKEWKSVRINFSDEDEYKLFRAYETLLIMEGRNVLDLMRVSYGMVDGEILEKVRGIVGSRELIDSAEKKGIKLYSKLLEGIREREFDLGIDYWVADGVERKVYRYNLARCLEKLLVREKRRSENLSQSTEKLKVKK